MSLDFASIRVRAANDAENIVRQFLGEPNRRRSNKRELRWGTHGSFKLDLLTGKWHDFESGEHGDMADLVCREMQSDQRAAFKWLLRWLGRDGRAGQRPEAEPAGCGSGAAGSGGPSQAEGEVGRGRGSLGRGSAAAFQPG